MRTQASGLQFTLSAGGQPAGTFAVVDFTLHEHDSSLFELELNLASRNPAVDFDAVLDRGATLSVWHDGVLQRAVSGIVTCFQQGDTGFQQTRYRMSVRPSLWRLGLRRNSRIFQLETIEQIISTLLREAQIVDYAFGLRHPHPAREFCVQYQESDLTFIQRLAAEEGIFFYFEFNQGRHTVVFADDSGIIRKKASLPYNPNVAAQANELCVNSLICSAQVRPAEVQLKDYTFKNPRWDATFTQQASGEIAQRRSYQQFDFPGRFKDQQHGKDFTRYRLEALRNDARLGRGHSNDFRLQPGILLTLSQHPRADLNCAWQLIATRHSGQQPQAMEQEAGEQGTHLNTEFQFIPRSQTWRPTPLPKPVIDGPHLANVVGPGNEEIFCDEHGRIRVQFRWDRYGNSDDHSSCWIRVSQPWAGQGWGMIAIPRVGQEVVIHFLHGDPDQPIVTGRTYHAVNRAALKLPMAKTQMVLRSKTHKGEGYNELRFEDAKGREGLFLRAQRDMTTQVLNNRVSEVGANHIETVQQNQQIEIGQHYHFTAHGNHTLTVQGDQHTKINGQQQRTVQQVLELASARGIRLESGASALELHADGRISLHGKNFNLYATHNGQITASQALDLNDEQQLAEASQWIKNAFAGKPLTVETGANITPEAAATANTTTDGEHNRTEPALSTLNSAAVGRLLAAGALYHQNPETFATIAEQLGGEALNAYHADYQDPSSKELIGQLSTLTDFVPVVGDIKGFAEAEDTLDFLAAAIGVIPVVGDVAGKALKAAKQALKKGDVAGAAKLVNQASEEVSAYNAATYAGLKLDLKTTEAANQVVESLRTTGELPSNYLSKSQAISNGWKKGKALNNTVPGGQLGGDVFANSNNVLPSAHSRIWREADIGLDNTMSRSNQPGTRLLYSNDGLLYITIDHYETVTPIGRWK
ncbi:type VI secretion system tip protein TssI/VgrG [Serratia microhaemolytica]|uniref:type VI secretion system tip protein TssI/VgrG n=1 Tax=Serratia microhaemolytica TaxID=2675110 RepID=UPI000FDEC335